MAAVAAGDRDRREGHGRRQWRWLSRAHPRAHCWKFGREAELVAVDTMLASARSGLAALVLEGEPGIGKTSVWRAGLAHAADRGYLVLSCRAAPTEARLSFAALGDLLAPADAASFDALPVPQRHALDVALLRADSGGAVLNARAIGTGASASTQRAGTRSIGPRWRRGRRPNRTNASGWRMRSGTRVRAGR